MKTKCSTTQRIPLAPWAQRYRRNTLKPSSMTPPTCPTRLRSPTCLLGSCNWPTGWAQTPAQDFSPTLAPENFAQKRLQPLPGKRYALSAWKWVMSPHANKTLTPTLPSPLACLRPAPCRQRWPTAASGRSWCWKPKQAAAKQRLLYGASCTCGAQARSMRCTLPYPPASQPRSCTSGC